MAGAAPYQLKGAVPVVCFEPYAAPIPPYRSVYLGDAATKYLVLRGTGTAALVSLTTAYYLNQDELHRGRLQAV